MNKVLARVYEKAKAAGRLCARCQWIVTVKDAKKGHKLCGGCRSALRGVDISYGHSQPLQEPQDNTGNTL